MELAVTDYDTWETVFERLQGFNVHLTAKSRIFPGSSREGDVTIKGPGIVEGPEMDEYALEVQLWLPDDDYDGTGEIVGIPYDDIVRICIY